MSQTIFVLEDDPDISRLVQYHLESAGFTVKPYLAIQQIYPTPNASLQPCSCSTPWFPAAMAWISADAFA